MYRFGPTVEVGDVPPALSAPYHQREDVLLELTKISDDQIDDRFQDSTARF